MVRLIGALLGVVLAKASYICTHPSWTSDCVCLAMDTSMSNKLVASTPFQSNLVNFNFTSGDDNNHLRIPVQVEDDPYFQMHGDSCVTHPHEDQGFQMQPCANVDSPGFHDDSPD